MSLNALGNRLEILFLKCIKKFIKTYFIVNCTKKVFSKSTRKIVIKKCTENFLLNVFQEDVIEMHFSVNPRFEESKYKPE